MFHLQVAIVHYDLSYFSFTVFEWDDEDNVPLFVANSIELPQLQLVENYTKDCTQHYSTGLY